MTFEATQRVDRLLAALDGSGSANERAAVQELKALPFLQEQLASAGAPAGPDMAAAIDAIESENQDYFLDRDQTGLITLNVTLND